MIALQSKGLPSRIAETIVGRIIPDRESKSSFYVSKESIDGFDPLNSRIDCLLTTSDNAGSIGDHSSITKLPGLGHLSAGDIVSIDPSGLVRTVFRLESHHNAFFVTDRCNSKCLMCSQPPRNIDDIDYHHNINIQMLDLIPRSTEQIGITGGEPTLLGPKLLELLRKSSTNLPDTGIHMLSNGRAFAWRDFTREFAGINDRLVVGIPLYADNSPDHDYIVQARDAFTQTILGLHNLERYGIQIEIRIVLHKLTYTRLPKLARFIYRNLPFVDHVAFMGLEYVGYTPHNHDLLWIEPGEYMNQLDEAISYLTTVGMNCSIYNLQHCLLREKLWQYSRKSISDWKRDYPKECKGCTKIDDCGGVFSTSRRLSKELSPIF